MIERMYKSEIAFSNERAAKLFEVIADSLALSFDRSPVFGLITMSLALHNGRVIRQSFQTEKHYRYNGTTDEENRETINEDKAVTE